MRVIELNCNRCGAALEVTPKTRFATCTFCGTKLQIQSDGQGGYTEVLDEIASDVKAIRRSADLQQLDQEWETRRGELVTHGKHGASVPNVAASVMMMIVPTAFGIFWIGFAQRIEAPAAFSMFGVVFILVALIAGGLNLGKANEYSQKRAEYERKRRELMSE